MQIAAAQAAKASGSYNNYKNELFGAMKKVADKVSPGKMPEALIQEMYDLLIVQTTENLEQVVA